MRGPLALAVVGAAVLGLATGAGVGYLTQPTNPPLAAAAAGQAAAPGQTAGPTGQSGASGQTRGQGGQAGAAARIKPSAGGGQTAGRAPTSGTVEQVEASKLTVRTEDGTVDVPLSDTTVVQKLVKATASELKVGDLVVGRGSADAQGALRLTALQILPPGAERPGFGLLGGAQGKPDNTGAADKPAGTGAAGQPGGRGGQAGGAGGEGTDGRGGVAGTVARIDGATLVVTTTNGDVTATLADDAELRRLTTAGRDEIKAGQSITVVGGSAGARTVVTITAV